MKYRLTCPACSNAILVGSGQAGQIVDCSCGQKVDVPSVRNLQQLEAVADEAGRASRWSKRQGLMFLGGVLTIAALVAAGVIWAAQRSVVDVEAARREASELTAGSAYLLIQSADPPLGKTWAQRAQGGTVPLHLEISQQLLIGFEGLGPRYLAPNEAYRVGKLLKGRESLREWLPIAALAGLIGLAIFCSALFIRTPQRAARGGRGNRGGPANG